MVYLTNLPNKKAVKPGNCPVYFYLPKFPQPPEALVASIKTSNVNLTFEQQTACNR